MLWVYWSLISIGYKIQKNSSKKALLQNDSKMLFTISKQIQNVKPCQLYNIIVKKSMITEMVYTEKNVSHYFYQDSVTHIIHIIYTLI